MYSQMTDAQLEQALLDAARAGTEQPFENIAAEAERRHAQREARLTAPGALGNAAVWYASQGIAVFPLQPGDKKPYPGSRGFKDATTDMDRARAWWNKHPTSNIGLPTGHLFDVIDIDGPTGARSLHDLHASGALPAIHAIVSTGRECGRHLYVTPTGDGNAAAVWPGIDYRGLGGYVVAPPSVTTRRYTWIQALDVATLRPQAVTA